MCMANLNAQVIWSENFNSYANCITTGANNNTVNPASDWTSSYSDCDDGAITCTASQSFWGIFSGEFRVNDIEGGPCSGGSSCSPGGTTQNFLTTEQISLASVSGASLSVEVRQTGTFESGALIHCDNSADVVHITYSVNGGPFVQFANNGFLTGTFGSVTASQSCVT